jgi:ferric-dicitrate binding protein FerR (iron transport regulator)
MMKKENISKDVYLAKWIAGELSDAELKSIVGEDEFQAFLKIRRALEVQEALDSPVKKTFAELEEKLQPKKPKLINLYSSRVAGIAATILVILGIFWFFNSSEVSVSTGFGEQQSITLIDGSEVILNSKSTLSYDEDNWQDNRSLELQGEAYFKVAKGKTFSVKTPNGKVQVLGTQFNVNSTKDFFEVVCYEGKVEVHTSDQKKHILTPNKSVRKINGNTSQRADLQDTEPSWISGETSFRKVPLYLVIISLENEFNLKINAKDVDGTINYTGAFPHNNLETALQVVFQPLNIEYEMIDKSNIKLSNSK